MVPLTAREEQILKRLVRSFIHTAAPVGSARLAKDASLGLRSASVRRIMAILEEKGYVTQPHTSAGRIPTTEGYRYYVNELLGRRHLSSKARNVILEAVHSYSGDVDLLLENVSRSLAGLSRQLGIVVRPKIQLGVFERVQLLPVASAKTMAVLTASGNFVKTGLIETKTARKETELKEAVRLINRTLQDKPLLEAKAELRKLQATLENKNAPVAFFLLELEQRLFNFSHYEKYLLDGTRNILQQPEFSDVARVSKLIDLLEDRDILIHFMEKREVPPGIRVTIGEEHAESRIRSCSVITSTYASGQVSGIVGIIGPTRLPYGTLIPLVEFTAQAISEILN